MRKQKRYVYLDSKEYDVVLHSLIRFKNKLIRQGRHTEFVDEVILKVIDAPAKKTKIA